MTNRLAHNNGFTLIELLVAIAVIGALAGALIVIINPATMLDRARVAKGKSFQGQLAQGPLAYYEAGIWQFTDSTSPGKDTSGYNDTATFLGGALYVDTCDVGFGGCISLDGVDDYLNMGQPAQLQFTGSFTLSAWINTTETGLGGIIRKWYNTSGNRSYRFLVNNGTLSLNLSNDGTAVYQSNYAAGLNDGKWHMTTAVFDATNTSAILYIDGNKVTTTTGFPSSVYNNSQNFNVGSADSGVTGANDFAGQIDEVFVFNQALTQASVQKYFASSARRHFLASLL